MRIRIPDRRKKMRKRQGTTLLETLISTAIFSFLALAIFSLYDIGRVKWNVMYLRHQLQNDARNGVSGLERDLRKTDYSSVDVYTNPRVIPPGWPEDKPVPRWAICMIGLDDWNNPNNFDPVSGKPIWNQYVIYMATKQINKGNQGPLGGAGSGQFLRIVEKFNASAEIPLPLHNPIFVSTVDWVNNEFADYSPTRLQKAALPLEQSKRLFAGLTLESIPGTKVGDLIDPNDPGLIFDSGGTTGGTPTGGTTGGGAFFADFILPPLTNPNPNIDPWYEFAEQDDYSGIVASIRNETNDSLSRQDWTSYGATEPGSPLRLLSVDLKSVGSAFAFLVNKDDAQRVIGVSFKTKGYVSRSPHNIRGFESRQINMDVAPQVYHEK